MQYAKYEFASVSLYIQYILTTTVDTFCCERHYVPILAFSLRGVPRASSRALDEAKQRKGLNHTDDALLALCGDA